MFDEISWHRNLKGAQKVEKELKERNRLARVRCRSPGEQTIVVLNQLEPDKS